MIPWEIKTRQRDVKVMVGVLERKVDHALRLVRLLTSKNIDNAEKESICLMLKDCSDGIDFALDPVDSLVKTLAKHLQRTA